MIRIFNRYLPIRDTLYFILENTLFLLFLMWATMKSGGWESFIIVPLVVQASLYYNELHPSLPRFSLKEFWVKHLRAVLLAAGILAVIYMLTPVDVVSWRSFWARLALFPVVLIGLRLGYQTLVAAYRLDTSEQKNGTEPKANL